MTLNELIAQLDQLEHDEKMQVLSHLIDDLEHETTSDLPADEAAELAQEDIRWNASFAQSQDLLARMAARTRQHRDQGLNRELDPDEL